MVLKHFAEFHFRYAIQLQNISYSFYTSNRVTCSSHALISTEFHFVHFHILIPLIALSLNKETALLQLNSTP